MFDSHLVQSSLTRLVFGPMSYGTPVFFDLGQKNTEVVHKRIIFYYYILGLVTIISRIIIWELSLS